MKNKMVLEIDLLNEANIPHAHRSLGIDTYFGDAAALKQARKYSRELDLVLRNNVNLLFFGQPRSLKTFLLCAILKSALIKGIDCKYVTLDHLSDYTFNKETRLAFEKEFGSPILLGLDNLNHCPNKWVKHTLLRLLKLRRDQGRPLVMASSLDHEQLTEDYGPEIMHYMTDSTVLVSCQVDPVVVEQKSRLKLKGIEC